ncbi:hypothetical protein MCHI_002651 [Candidatus Magnetoovum chiemensis]|nr:hypothetical protein MCHI_002651 [Candidatus Magnetoovum chiemensis]
MILPIDSIIEESREYYLKYRQSLAAQILFLPYLGAVEIKKKGSQKYCYIQKRANGKKTSAYIGKIDDDRVKKAYYAINKRKAFIEELKIVTHTLKKLGHSLKTVDLTNTIHKLLKLFAKHGLWEQGLEIVGSWCFNIYQIYLGVQDFPLRTEDLDIAVRLPYKGNKVDIAVLLKSLGFVEDFYPNGVVFYRCEGIRVEFIVPQKAKGSISGKISVPELNISAQPLRFLDILCSNPMTIKIKGGINVSVPSPSAFALHKLLIAQRRTDKEKARKDYIQAYFVLKMLFMEDMSNEIYDVIKTLHLSWVKKIKSVLNNITIYVPEIEKDTAAHISEVLSQTIE